MSRQQD